MKATSLYPKLFCLILLMVSTMLLKTSRQRVTADAAIVTLVRWPYLQQVTHNSAYILWTTNIKGNPALQYGTGGIEPQPVGIVSRQVNTSSRNYYEHKVMLDQLKPKTWYYYQIFENNINLTPSGKRWFRTGHLNGEFTFIAFGDSGLGTPEQYQVRDRITEQEFDILLHTGDLEQTDGSYEHIETHHFSVYRWILSNHPFFPTIGNHEYMTDNGQPYLDIFDLPKTAWDMRDLERYYSFNWGYAHFVSLDSEGPLRRISDAVDDDMADWLEADLAADDHPWKIVIVHRPPYSSSSAHTEVDVREKLSPIFETHNVDLVLSGHNHGYERTVPIRNGAKSTLQEGGVVYIVTGGGGAQIYPVPGDWFTAARVEAYHFVKIRVTNCALSLTAIDKEGAVIDRALLDKCPYHSYLPHIAHN